MRTKEIPPELARLLRELDGPTRARLEPRAVRALNACGCSSGAFGLLFGVVTSLVWWLTRRDGRVVMWPELGVAAIAVLGVTMAAKGGGMLFARVWLAWLRHSLMRAASGRSWTSV